MQSQPLYRAIAAAIAARNNCIKAWNAEGVDKWENRLTNLTDLLPQGSGFDNGTTIDLDESRSERLVLFTSFHHMDENGFYDGWTDHRITIVPSLQFDFNIRIGGRNRNDIKEHMYEVFRVALSRIA